MDKLEELVQDIRGRVIGIETKLDDYNGIREKLDKAYGMSLANTEDIKEIKSDSKWLWRTSLGAVIAATVAFFVKVGGWK